MSKTNIVLFSDEGEITKAITDLLQRDYFITEYHINLSGIQEVINPEKGSMENADLIILNLSQVTQNLEKIVSKLHTSYPNIPLIILHHYKQKTFAAAFIKMGAKAYLPIQLLNDELLPAIGQVLSNEVFISKSVK